MEFVRTVCFGTKVWNCEVRCQECVYAGASKKAVEATWKCGKKVHEWVWKVEQSTSKSG